MQQSEILGWTTSDFVARRGTSITQPVISAMHECWAASNASSKMFVCAIGESYITRGSMVGPTHIIFFLIKLPPNLFNRRSSQRSTLGPCPRRRRPLPFASLAHQSSFQVPLSSTTGGEQGYPVVGVGLHESTKSVSVKCLSSGSTVAPRAGKCLPADQG